MPVHLPTLPLLVNVVLGSNARILLLQRLVGEGVEDWIAFALTVGLALRVPPKTEHPLREFTGTSRRTVPPWTQRSLGSQSVPGIFRSSAKTSRRLREVSWINQLIAIGQECVIESNVLASALQSSEDAFLAYKVAFADEAFKAFTLNRDQVAPCSPPALPESSTLVVTVNEDAANEEVDTKFIDQLLEAAESGPVPQVVRRKEGKVFISFSDAVQSGRAKAVMETKPECRHLFHSVDTQAKLFPAVILNVDVADLDVLKKELAFRNPMVSNSILKVHTIFRSPNNVTGHVKLFFGTKSIRDAVVKAGNLFACGRRFRVVEVDLNREVRRCFRCQAYGHIAKTASNVCLHDEVCGFCAGAHSSKTCARTGPPKCANCSKAHRAGDPSCTFQIRAVNRFRAAIDQ